VMNASVTGNLLYACVRVCGRYQMFLQLKLDLVIGRLGCSDSDAAELCALALQCQSLDAVCTQGAPKTDPAGMYVCRDVKSSQLRRLRAVWPRGLIVL